MKSKRRRHDPEFKARVALEAMKGLRTVQQIAKEHDIHPVQVTQWKKTMEKEAFSVFEGPGSQKESSKETQDKERECLHAKIGELTVENDFLKKKCKQLGVSKI